MPNQNPLERLVFSDIKPIAAEEVLRRIEVFLDQCEGMAGIIIIGKEGDTRSMRCRPTRNLPRTRVGELMRVAIANFARPDPPGADTDPIIEIPGMRRLSLRETVQRIEGFIQRCPGITLLIVICKEDSMEKVHRVQSSNLPNGAAREVLRNALAAFDKTGLPPPVA